MSKLLKPHVFTSESVSEGHPDKVADQISDAILDACLAKNPSAHVACETAVGKDIAINLGEILGIEENSVNYEAIARDVVKGIGYDRPSEGFSYDSFHYLSRLHEQSADINMGVTRENEEDQGAGDQGLMFGYATNETPELMPATLILSHKLVKRCADLRKSGEKDFLRPDSKAQVSIFYKDGRPQKIETVVLSHQTVGKGIDFVRDELEAVARDTLADTKLVANDTKFLINPTGNFEIGGPCGDSGVTGRKIIVDTYGGVASHGGGAFSGKDPSKVDRSAAYYARYAAKNIVAAGLADKCEIQVSYAIGVADPTSINVSISTFGTSKYPEEKIERMLMKSGIFNFRPCAIIRQLGLKNPSGWSYRDTATYGHFGRDLFPWEKTDKIDAILSAMKSI